MVVIDFMNPVEHIKTELERLLNEVTNFIDSSADDLAIKMNSQSLPEHLKPSKSAMPVQRKKKGGERYPKTYLPEWYEALLIHRLKLLKHQEKSICM